MKSAYEVLQEMVAVLEAELEAMRIEQRRRGRGEVFDNRARNLAQACALVQGELRKTINAADDAIELLSPETRTRLVLRILKEMSPEHRAAVRVFLEELGEALI